MVDCIINVKTYENGKCIYNKYVGRMETLSEKKALVTFDDENGRVEFLVSDEPHMLRRGEYSLDFTFKKGETVSAAMSFGKNKSTFLLYTEEYAYSVTDGMARAYIKYYFDFGKEKQNLKVILTAKTKEPL